MRFYHWHLQGVKGTLFIYCYTHDYEKQGENLEREGECVYDRVRNECRRARFGCKKIPAYDRTLYH